MHIKILNQSTGGTLKNTGSCKGVAEYLEHENNEKRIESISDNIEFSENHFFSLDNNKVPIDEVVDKIDNNKAKLCNDEDKFYVIIVNPSKEEISKMGNTQEEIKHNFRDYVKENVMQQYAENFNKKLNKEDILFYGKIHEKRAEENKDQNLSDLHAHVIVSRKNITNKIKISPLTNHKSTSKGAIKGGFDRKNFYEKIEQSFDDKFKYNRKIEDTFLYKNTMKNGKAEDKIKMIDKKIEAHKKAPIIEQKEVKKEHKIEQNISHQPKAPKFRR